MIDEKIKQFYTGKKTTKKFNGKLIEVIPFLYTSNDSGQIGIGIQNSSGDNLILETHSPNTIIRWWRSLKILEALPIINDETLALCFSISCKKMGGDRISTLADQMSEDRTFRTTLNEILNSAPDQVDLIRMISNLKSKGIRVNHRELLYEINKGKISSNKIIRLTISRALRLEKSFRKTSKLLPEKYSLNKFFLNLGITSLGNHCLSTYNLDKKIRVYCLNHKKGNNYSLLMDNVEPSFKTLEGTLYTFESAKFRKGRFYVKTKINVPHQEETVSEYTLDELREKLNQLI